MSALSTASPSRCSESLLRFEPVSECLDGIVCSDQATLTWAGAYNLDSEVASYHIWIDEEMPTGSGNWSGMQEVGVVDANTNAFVHEGATFGATYKYHIVAEMTSGSRDPLQRPDPGVQLPWSPEFHVVAPGFCFGQWDGQHRVDLDPNSNDTHAYTLQRKRSSEAEFTDLETQDGVGGMTLTYTDYTAKTNESSYSYRVRVENFCSDSVGMSNTAETVWLRGHL